MDEWIHRGWSGGDVMISEWQSVVSMKNKWRLPSTFWVVQLPFWFRGDVHGPDASDLCFAITLPSMALSVLFEGLGIYYERPLALRRRSF